MMLLWEKFGQSTDNYMVAFLPNSCFKHSLLELTVLAIVEKTKAE